AADASGPDLVTIAHTYTAAGAYTAALRVTDNGIPGATAIAVIGLTILQPNQVPIAMLSADRTSGKAPLSVNFNAAGSLDPDGLITLYEWDFDFDGIAFAADASGSDLISSPHIYPVEGAFTAALRVRDDDGAYSAIQTIALTILPPNKPPVPVITASPAEGHAPLEVTLDGSGSYDPDGIIILCEWDLDFDGAAFVPDLSGPTLAHVIHAYEEAGQKTIALRVTDSDIPGLQAMAMVQVNVFPPNLPPIALICADPTTGKVPLEVSFDGGNSHDPDGAIILYAWNFGDAAPPANGITVHHIYQTEGVYSASLIVTDDDGANSAPVSATITVAAANLAPIAVITADPVSGNAPLVVTLSGGDSSDPEGGAIAEYEWDIDYNGTTFNVTHTGVSVAPTFIRSSLVGLQVKDAEGAVSAIATQQINVVPDDTPPEITILEVTPQNDGTMLITFTANEPISHCDVIDEVHEEGVLVNNITFHDLPIIMGTIHVDATMEEIAPFMSDPEYAGYTIEQLLYMFGHDEQICELSVDLYNYVLDHPRKHTFMVIVRDLSGNGWESDLYSDVICKIVRDFADLKTAINKARGLVGLAQVQWAGYPIGGNGEFQALVDSLMAAYNSGHFRSRQIGGFDWPSLSMNPIIWSDDPAVASKMALAYSDSVLLPEHGVRLAGLLSRMVYVNYYPVTEQRCYSICAETSDINAYLDESDISHFNLTSDVKDMIVSPPRTLLGPDETVVFTDDEAGDLAHVTALMELHFLDAPQTTTVNSTGKIEYKELPGFGGAIRWRTGLIGEINEPFPEGWQWVAALNADPVSDWARSLSFYYTGLLIHIPAAINGVDLIGAEIICKYQVSHFGGYELCDPSAPPENYERDVWEAALPGAAEYFIENHTCDPGPYEITAGLNRLLPHNLIQRTMTGFHVNSYSSDTIKFPDIETRARVRHYYIDPSLVGSGVSCVFGRFADLAAGLLFGPGGSGSSAGDDDDNASVDLQICKPKIIDSGESVVPDNEELTKGSYTFANLDNDDNDSSFDINDDNGVANDNELVKLICQIRPASMRVGIVKIQLSGAAGCAKLWMDSGKAIPYSDLDVASFAVKDGVKIKELWVEGIAPNTAPQGTIITATYSLNGNNDQVALTVIGISSIGWEGINNSRNNDNTLTNDDNWPSEFTPAGLCVFPDARIEEDGAVGQPRNKVNVNVALTVAPPGDVKFYLKSFDVDDPNYNVALR
ncbi:PKD domain-containing protein, partial [Candidatus Woesearchaeota archaeon]|nr:PKD domain-containing protein [Candidatus Woesearchaeota archaeon]